MHRRAFLLGSATFALCVREAWAAGGTENAAKLIQSQVDAKALAGAVLHLRHGSRVTERAFGSATPASVFYLASITKPMTATALMILVDRGRVSLEDPVQKYLPEFAGADRENVLVRHLVTHTSGLPDMLPENEALRKRHAPLKDYVASACKTPLLFPPGTRTAYQSSGILLAGEIVERVSGKSLADFLKREVFEPLGMKSSSLGLGGRKLEETMQLQRDAATDWAQNSPYWRNLGAPWADVHSTAADVGRFVDYFVKPEPPILKPATAAAMITDQNKGLSRPWGIGWSLGSGFGKNASARTYGHSGSSGTLAWLDPENDFRCVLLTTLPASFSQRTILGPVADLLPG
jgi:CubicO group peptidase (beta-lactamase class C family)